MIPLPFDFVRLGTLRDVMLWRLLPLPLLCAVGTWPLIDVQAAIESLVSIVEPLAHALATPPAKIAEFMVVMASVCAAAVAYTLGWILNFALLACFRRHSSTTLMSAFVGGPMPATWEKDGAAAKVQAARLKDESDWSIAREIGAFRYIVVRGGLLFGSVAFTGIHIVLNWVQSLPISGASLPLKFAVWVLFGMVIAAARWWSLRRAFRGEA